ncbi:hypothetical protein Dimus_032869 [Dionaea muscipula]
MEFKRKQASRRSHEDNNEDGNFKSKNLHAERNRRQRIGDRLLQLRALVPNITNMKKATIICDAIDYINELEEKVSELTGQLSVMDDDQVSDSDEEMKSRSQEDQKDVGVHKWSIEPDVKVVQIDYSKIWVKVVYEKRRGMLTKLLEAMSFHGYEFIDTSLLTTSDGAAVLTSSLEGLYGSSIAVEETRELLLKIINNM